MINKKVSIIVPIYNGDRYIENLIECINKQKYKSYEVILVNDGSTDKTDSICQELLKNNNKIKYIKKENTGVSDSRNQGMSIATGEYICFVDVDDMISENYLKDFIDSADMENKVLCCCQYQKIT